MRDQIERFPDDPAAHSHLARLNDQRMTHARRELIDRDNHLKHMWSIAYGNADRNAMDEVAQKRKENKALHIQVELENIKDTTPLGLTPEDKVRVERLHKELAEIKLTHDKLSKRNRPS